MQAMKIKELIAFLSQLDQEKEFIYDCGEYVHVFYDLQVVKESDEFVMVECG